MKNRNYTQKSSGSGQKRKGRGRLGAGSSGKSSGKFAKSAKKGGFPPRRSEGRFEEKPSLEGRKTGFGDKRRKPQRVSLGRAKSQPEEKPFLKKERKIVSLPARKGIYLWGFHAVKEAWLNEDRTCYRLMGTSAAQAQFLSAFHEGRKKVANRPSFDLMTKEGIDSLLPHSAVHQGIALEVDPLPDLLLFEILQTDNLPDVIVVLDQVTDPHNIGAVLRSAAAFGAGAVVVTEKNAPETTGVMAKSASGAMDHVPLVRVVNLSRAIQELQQAGYWCVGLAEEGKKDISALKLSGKTAIVLGAEGDGLRRLTRESCDELARLPTLPPIGSLNVSNAAAVALYEIRRQLVARSEES